VSIKGRAHTRWATQLSPSWARSAWPHVSVAPSHWHGGGGTPVAFGSGERAHKVEHDEAEAIAYAMGCEGA
jgi:hypothetical protein